MTASVRRLDRKIDRIVLASQDLQSVDTEELVRRNQKTAQPDGYPGGSSEVVVQSSSDDTSTERAALYGLPADERTPDDWRRHSVRDDIDLAISEFERDLDAVDRLLNQALRRVEFVKHVRDSARGRQSSLAGMCKACGQEVPLIARGYCDPCRKAWERDDKPLDTARVIFEKKRWLRAHPTCDDSDWLDWRRRQHTDSDGVGPMPPVIPLGDEPRYRRHELPPPIDPDDVLSRPCSHCGLVDGDHYSWCDNWQADPDQECSECGRMMTSHDATCSVAD